MPNNETNTTTKNDGEPLVLVLCRFTRQELDWMRDETGSIADATAVTCFCRKNMRKA